jgi:hypothetical protein
MSEGGEPSAPATPGLLLLSYTTPRDAATAMREFAEQYVIQAEREAKRDPTED